MAFSLDYVGNPSSPAGGHYRLGLVTGGTTGLTANQAFFCLRFAGPAPLQFALINMRLNANISTAFGTAQLVDAALWVNRNYTTSPSGGTTVLPFKPNENQMRDVGGVGMQPLGGVGGVFAGIQISTTAALTTGTRTQDTNPIGYTQFNNSNALGNCAESEIFKLTPGVSHPLLLGVNEGLELTVPTAQGATGVVKYYVSMEFALINQF